MEVPAGEWQGDWFFNTNETYAPGAYKKMFEEGVIAIYGYETGPENLAGSQDGQRVFAYVNRMGVLAVGKIRDSNVEAGSSVFDQDNEFHVRVEWTTVVPEEKGVTNAQVKTAREYNLPVRSVFCGMSRHDVADWIEGWGAAPSKSLPTRATKCCSPAFGGHPASIVPAAYSSVPKTGQNRRTSRPHLALRGTTWHKPPPTCTRTCAFEGPLGSPRRAIQPSSREKTAHDLRVGELQWPPEDGENVTNRTVNAPPKTGQNAEIGNAAVRAASGERAARARLPITVIDRQSLGEALAWWRKSYAT